MLAQASSTLVRLTLREKEEQRGLVSAGGFYQFLWSHDFKRFLIQITDKEMIFMAEKMPTKYGFLTFFFFFFSLLLVLFLLIFFQLIFLPFQPSKERGAYGRVWSVLTSNASSTREIFLWQFLGLHDYFLVQMRKVINLACQLLFDK